MAIVRGDQICLHFGTHVLLENARISLESGEKVALIGRNGAGKSSLMKLIAGFQKPDSGEIQIQKGLRIRYLEQTLPVADERTVFDYVAQGVSDIQKAQKRYESLLAEQGSTHEINQLHDFLDKTDGWHWQQRVDAVLTRLNLNGEQTLSSLSGGWRRRVALAECLAAEPDLLLLDEPTNHLDLDTIEWLESALQQFKGAMLLVSHDRCFIDALVTRLWEIDRGVIRVFPAPYQAYLDSKEKQLEDEAKTHSEFDKRLAQEETWIRQGIKARRTRNEGRVRALKKMRQERAERRERQTTAKLQLKAGDRSGKIVVELDHVTLTRGEKKLFRDVSYTLLKGEKLGILGANGSGKSSLIKLILGELKPDSGRVELGSQLDIAYFDQMRSTINPNLTIIENVGEGRDFLEVNGSKRHVISYLSDYGFGPERMQTPASSLSGGEISRLVLAKLFTRSANLLILDEPTNDLDIETLELLESQLVEFAGTVIVISHDRQFLDNLVASMLVFEPSGGLIEITGGFADYQRYRAQRSSAKDASPVREKPAATTHAEKPGEKIKNTKLSYKFQRELELLPAELEALEVQIQQVEQLTNSPDFHQTGQDKMQDVFQQLADLHQTLEHKMNRWEELEAMKSVN